MRSTPLLCVACLSFLIARSACGEGLEDRRLGLPGPSAVAPASHTTPSSLGSAAMRTGGSLVAVVAIIGGAAWAFKHLAKKGVLPASFGTGARSPSGLLEVLARYPMGGGQSLVVLKFDRRILLVCQSAAKGLRRGSQPISAICELSEPEDVASVLLKVRGQEQAAMAEKFQQMLASEDALVERVMAPTSRPAKALPVPARAHEKSGRSARPAAVAQTPVASAAVIRTRLAAMRQQSPQPEPAAASVRPPTVPASRPRQVSRTEFVG